MFKRRSEACAGNGVQSRDRTHQASASAAGDPGRRGRDLTGRPSDRALSAVDRGGDRDEEDADRDQNDEAAPGHERRRRHDQDQRREADAPQQSGGLRGRIGGGGRDARHQKSVEDRRAERQPSGAP